MWHRSLQLILSGSQYELAHVPQISVPQDGNLTVILALWLVRKGDRVVDCIYCVVHIVLTALSVFTECCFLLFARPLVRIATFVISLDIHQQYVTNKVLVSRILAFSNWAPWLWNFLSPQDSKFCSIFEVYINKEEYIVWIHCMHTHTYFYKFCHLFPGHWCPCRCSISGVCGPVSKCRPARLPSLAGHGEALRRSVGTLCLGYPVYHSHSVHLHRRASYHMGAGNLVELMSWSNGSWPTVILSISFPVCCFAFTGGIFPLPVPECLYCAAPFNGLGHHGRDMDQCFTHCHH